MADQPEDNKDAWTTQEKLQLRDYLTVLHSSLKIAGPPPVIFADTPIAPSTSTSTGPKETGRGLLCTNDVYMDNLSIRFRNHNNARHDWDAALEPMMDIDTGEVIVGFPRTLRAVEELEYEDGVRILKALGETEFGGDEDKESIMYRIRRWAAIGPVTDGGKGKGKEKAEGEA